MDSTSGPCEVPIDDRAILTKYGPAVERFCLSRARTREDAQDAAQDTFARFIRRSQRNLENPEAWLIRIASRACIDIHRRQVSEEGRQLLLPIDEQRDAVASHALGAERALDPETLVAQRQLVCQIMRHLSARERFVLIQLYLEDSTYQQVAKALGQSVPYTRVLAQRARDHARSVAKHICREPRPRRAISSRPLPMPTPNGGLSTC